MTDSCICPWNLWVYSANVVLHADVYLHMHATQRICYTLVFFNFWSRLTGITPKNNPVNRIWHECIQTYILTKACMNAHGYAQIHLHTAFIHTYVCMYTYTYAYICAHAILHRCLAYRRRGRVGKGVGHLAHVWIYGVREVVSLNPDRGNIVGWDFHPTRWLARFSLIWICLSFQILNLFRTLSSWGRINYRPSAPLLYEVASHVKKLPFRPILLLL